MAAPGGGAHQHLDHGVAVQAGSLRRSRRFGNHHVGDYREVVVDQLGTDPGTGRAAVDDGVAHALQDRVSPLHIFGLTSHHDQEGSLLGFPGGSPDRCVHRPLALGTQPLGQVIEVIGEAGAHVDQQRVITQ